MVTKKQWLLLLTLLSVKETISMQYSVNTFNLVNSTEVFSVHSRWNTLLVLLGSLYVTLYPDILFLIWFSEECQPHVTLMDEELVLYAVIIDGGSADDTNKTNSS